MTELNAMPRRPRFPRPRIVAAAVLAALALAGCSATHVGESWQCPLAQGGSCESVAGADPAVPARAEGEGAVVAAPLYRVGTGRDTQGSRDTVRAEQACDTQCGHFAWLARLFAADGGGARPPGPEAANGADGGASNDVAVRPAPRAVMEDTLPLPVDDDTPPVDTADDLREAEVIGRIWIAPFVDGGGIYREGAYVRAVLAPAAWRLR